MRVKRLIVNWLEQACTLFDRLPWIDYDREYGWSFSRHGCIGCYLLHLSRLSAELDERWGTDCWKPTTEESA